MKLGEILFGLDAEYSGCTADTEISLPATDSRSCDEGSLFIAIDGTKRCGIDYIPDALSRGAAVCVIEREEAEMSCGIPSVIVDDTRKASAVIWNNYYKRPAEKMFLVGVTGTNGKTSTVHYLKSIFEISGRRVATVGTLGVYLDGKYEPHERSEVTDTESGMTTPDPKYLYGTLAKLKSAGVTDCIMEVSSHSILQKRIDALTFDIGVFTNLSPEHLDCHGTTENYFRVKASFFDKCRKTITNGDDAYGRRLCGIRYSKENITENKKADGVSYVLHTKTCDIPVMTSEIGEFTVYNTLAAAVTAYEAGIMPRDIASGIAQAGGVPGRMEHIVRREECGFDVYIDYAHTPRALESVLLELRRNFSGKLTAVFGCGGDRDRTKRPVMGKLASEICDRVIVTSDNPRGEDRMAIISEILSGASQENCEIRTCLSREEAIFYSIASAVPGEVILLAGKGHEEYEIENNKKRFFSEKSIVGEALMHKFGK